MMRTWTLRGLAALLALAVASPALRAGPETPTLEDKLNEVLSQLKDVKAKLANIQANQDLQVQEMQGDISRLKDDIRRLGDEVRRLSSTTQTNVAASINPVAPAAALVTGTIVLENRYPFPATIVINGQSYRVNPFEQRRVAEPVGRFSYAVYTDNGFIAQPQSDRFLAPGRDFPITINP